MRLVFRQGYKSINEFEPVELTNFSVLTGTNGSGKTQLLLALRDGAAFIEGVSKDDMVFFDYMQFRIKNDEQANEHKVFQERQNAWKIFNEQTVSSFGIPRVVLQKIRRANLPEEYCKNIKLLSEKTNIPVLQLKPEQIENLEMREKYTQYKIEIQKIFSHNAARNNNTIQGIASLAKKINMFVDEILEIDFLHHYVPTKLKENLLPTQLGEIFLDYRVKEYEEIHSSFDELLTMPRTQLMEEAIKKCKNMYGGSTPWDIVNKFLSTFSNFNYTISYPEKLTTKEYMRMSGRSFLPHLKHKEKDITINYDELSSGEQVLFALALCLFKTRSDQFFPKLLLLDEIDATLHPSMIENLLRVINDVFLRNGTSVILATHSPTTVALSQDKSIFIINPDGKKRIEKRSKVNALNILTEGYMSIERGIKLFDQIGKKELHIITEGNNTKYIKKAIELLAEEYTERVDVIDGIEGSSGSRQLKTLFYFFKKVPHDKKILFVWDCDVDIRSLESGDKTYAYKFEKNMSNQIAEKGIENNFDNEMFYGFTEKGIEEDAKGNSIEQYKRFNQRRKNDFQKYIIENATVGTFKNFSLLVEKIKMLLENKNV